MSDKMDIKSYIDKLFESGDIFLAEKLVLKDYKDFSKLVAQAYLARPDYESQYASSWKALIPFIEKMFNQISSKVDVEFTDADPYKSSKALRRDIEQNSRLKVWTGASNHPIFTEEQNWKFRAIHDYMTHATGKHPFSLRGEIGAYNRHVKTIPVEGRLALFTEVIGQVSTYFETSSHPPQKICKLWGFDYVNVGNVDEEEYKKNFPDQEDKPVPDEDKITTDDQEGNV